MPPPPPPLLSPQYVLSLDAVFVIVTQAESVRDVMKEEDSMETTQPASLEEMMVMMMEDSLLGWESLLLFNYLLSVSPL